MILMNFGIIPKNLEWSTLLCLAVISLLKSSSYGQSAVENCSQNVEATGSIGDLVHFTICLTSNGSQIQYMAVRVNKHRTSVRVNRHEGDWYWNWKSRNRVEAYVEAKIWDDTAYYSNITLAFPIADEHKPWHNVHVKIKKKDIIHIGVVATDAPTPNPFIVQTSTLASSTSRTRPRHTFTEVASRTTKPEIRVAPTHPHKPNNSTTSYTSSSTTSAHTFSEAASTTTEPGRRSSSTNDCVDDLDVVGDIRGHVVFTICLSFDFQLNGFMVFKRQTSKLSSVGDNESSDEFLAERNLNNTFISLQEGETSGGFRWEREETGDKIKILVIFSIASEEDFGTKEVGFYDSATHQLKTFNLQISRVFIRYTNDDNSKPAAIVAVVAVAAVFIAIVGFIVYKKKDQIVSYINHRTGTNDETTQKQPQPHKTNDTEDETILSNPVYGISK